MALMTRARRPLALLLLGGLAAFSLLMPFVPRARVSAMENRVLAPAPAWPRDLAGWRAAPRALDAYVADHFALRERLVHAGMRVQAKLGGRSGTPEAVEGRDGWLFLSDGLLQSTGQLDDAQQSDDYAAFVCDVWRRLARRGAKVLFTLIPSPAEIYPEQAPAWAGPARRPTDYDRVLERVRACGVGALDLRPALRAAKTQGQLYRKTDSHWTPRGTLAAYNAMVKALSHPDWARAPPAASWWRETRADGDLPRLARLEPRPEVVEIFPGATLDAAVRKPVPGVASTRAAPYQVAGGGDGRLLAIGDSFTEDSLGAAFAPFVGRFAWVHQDDCAFDWRVIDQVKPGVVLIAPAEREARCRRGRPLNLPPE